MPTSSAGAGGTGGRGSGRGRGGLAAPVQRPTGPTTTAAAVLADHAAAAAMPSARAAPACHHQHDCPQCVAKATSATSIQRLQQPQQPAASNGAATASRKRSLPAARLQQQPKAAAGFNHGIVDSEAAAAAAGGIRLRRRAQGVPVASLQQLGTASSGNGAGGAGYPHPHKQPQRHHTVAPAYNGQAVPPTQWRRRRRRKVGGPGILGVLLAWAKRPFVATAGFVTGRRGVLPLDSPFKRAWDVLTVCLSVIFLCIDAATLLRAQGGDHHAAANGSNGNGKATDGGSASSSSSSSSGPGSTSSAAASALGAMGLRDLLLLEVLWFALDMALQFRTEAEVTIVEEDPATGEERERTVLLQETQAIALHYLQRDFWLDLLFSFPWRGLSALLLLPRRKRPNRFRRVIGGAAKKVGGALGGAKRAIGDRIPRFLRWSYVKPFLTWTNVLEVKRVDGAKHIVRHRKSYRLLRYLVRGLRGLLRPHVFTFARRLGNKVAAHWAVGAEEDEEWEEEWEEVAWEGRHYQGGEELRHFHHHEVQQQHMAVFHHQHGHGEVGADAGLEEEEDEDVTVAGSTGSDHFDCEDEDGQQEEEGEGGQQWPALPAHVPVVPGVERGPGGERLML